MKIGKFNRFSSSFPATPVAQGFPQRNSAAIPVISECEINPGLISDITQSDLAIISKQMI
ncbi:hypothetical protein CUJ89_31180 [Burkholderia pyrrocinia]|uniref:Uncharacterized protein n=1 Tax=Burkholderia pyrrocinia TaxID=60550 RepID=A0A2Z5N6F7_BURPY|nr:hypothetical protein [Burkholderia pyrrocinia]AXF24716.1 hypothetical protein CUJ89_31180 [Burkholderia pyrrocinia]